MKAKNGTKSICAERNIVAAQQSNHVLIIRSGVDINPCSGSEAVHATNRIVIVRSEYSNL